MNFKQIDKQLKKINLLVQSIKEDGLVTKIERDLLKSYIAKLYEKVLDTDTDEVEIPAPAQPKPKKAPIVNPTVAEPAEQIETLVQKEMEVAESMEKVAPTQPAPEPAEHEPVVKEEAPALSASMNNLFQVERGGELSDKLSMAPIKDLTRCMGINEKMFTINELFGGNTDLFSKTMSDLNGFSNMDEARDYLLKHVANDQGWDQDDKYKKAESYIRLISRKYQ